ncbi:MAG: zinc ribbon domain-containing protein [Polyangia bacterium]
MSRPVECSQCQRPNEAGARFCTSCGKSLVSQVHCPACDYLQPSGSRFCMSCGATMAGATFASHGLADGAVIEGVWQRGPEEFIRRVMPEDCRTFLGSRVVRIPPGTVGVVVVGGSVERLLPPGEQTTVPLFERITNFFSGKGADTAFYLLDLRPIAIPFAVQSRPNSQGRSVQAQILTSFQLPRGDRDAVGTFLNNVLGARAGFTSADLYNLLRPEVTRIAGLVLERMASEGDGEIRYADAEAEIRRALSEQLARRYGLIVDVGVAPITSTASLSFRLGSDGEGGSGKGLFTADGEAVEVDLVVRVQGQNEDFRPERLQPALFAATAARLRGLPLAQLTSGEGFTAVEDALRTDAARELASFGMRLLSISVIDVRSKTGVWLLGARAEISRAQAELGIRREWLDQSDREVDVQELALQQALRRQQVERDARLRTLKGELEGARREHGLQAEHALAKDQAQLGDRRQRQDLIAGQADLDVNEARVRAQRQLELDVAARSVSQAQRQDRQTDELDELKHGAKKASTAFEGRADLARKELDLEAEKRQKQLELDSQRARRLAEDAAYANQKRGDVEFEDHSRRRHLDEDLADRAEARQVDKLRAMAELDQKIAAQENEHQLKLRDSLRGLGEREMIAMQATELAQGEGGGAAWAQALAAGDAQKEKEQRLQDQSRHASEMKDILQAQLDRMQALTERAMTTEASRQRDAGAAALYDRSLDAMSRVAASRAAPAPLVGTIGTGGTGGGGATPSEPAPVGPRCKSCGASLRPDARFCAGCGSAQGA